MQRGQSVGVGIIGIGAGGEALVDEIQIRVEGSSVEQAWGWTDPRAKRLKSARAAAGAQPPVQSDAPAADPPHRANAIALTSARLPKTIVVCTRHSFATSGRLTASKAGANAPALHAG